MNDIDKILEERGRNYGSYKDVSYCSQRLKSLLREMPSWDKLSNCQRESLDMICNKISRIVNGNPTYMDSWTDISGYATLVTDQQKGDAIAEGDTNAFNIN